MVGQGRCGGGSVVAVHVGYMAGGGGLEKLCKSEQVMCKGAWVD